jgi:Na+/H+ antiporter NhaD/arsenite permease-like protein
MNLAWISVAALLLAVILSCTTTINVGVVALALALLVGVYGGMSPDAVLAGFPVALFITLVGVTLLFSIAESNGTLTRLTARAVRVCRGHAGVLPIMFFALGLVIATIGAGATPASALLAPPAMAVAGRAGVPPLLMAIMAGHGVLAGTLSPFAPNGIVANGVMARIGLGGVEWQTYAYTALAHTMVGFGGFFVLGGWRLFKRHDAAVQAAEPAIGAMETGHWLTTAGIASLIVAVAGFGVNVGMVAIVIATVLILLRSVDEQKAIKGMPWGVILMVTGVTVLVALLEETEGLDLFTSGIARISTPASIAPIVALGTGIVSVYSSTGGVVLPAFLPMAPDLAQRMGGVEAHSIAWAMSVGSSLVDLSSLSTVGALFIAGAAAGSDARRLFNSLLAWGFSMALVAAAISWVLFGLA